MRLVRCESSSHERPHMLGVSHCILSYNEKSFKDFKKEDLGQWEKQLQRVEAGNRLKEHLGSQFAGVQGASKRMV